MAPAEPRPDSDPRAFLDAGPVGLAGRPGPAPGRAGRSPGPHPASYLAYWDRWAETWEFQALLKARAVAGDAALGSAFEQRGRGPGLGPPFRRRRTAPGPPAQGPGRAGRQPSGPGRPGAETGKGRHPRHRVRRPASAAGPRPGRPTAAVARQPCRPWRPWPPGGTSAPRMPPPWRPPTGSCARSSTACSCTRISRSTPCRATRRPGSAWPGCSATATRRSATAVAQFEADLRHHQSRVRWIHERLFFRPLLESFTAAPAGRGTQLLSPEAVADRLQAFGFADAERTSRPSGS